MHDFTATPPYQNGIAEEPVQHNGFQQNNVQQNASQQNGSQNSTAQAPESGYMHQFIPGRSYRFGAITPQDVAKSNWNDPTYIRKNHPYVVDGTWFIQQGCPTVRDFLERGVDEKGKLFPTNCKFLFQITDGTKDDLNEKLHVGQFAYRKTPPANGTPANALNDNAPVKKYRSNSSNDKNMELVLNSVKEAAQMTQATLQSERDYLRKENEGLRKENGNLKVENDALRLKNSTLEQENTLYKNTLDKTRTDLQTQFDEYRRTFKEEQEKLRKIEDERDAMEVQQRILEAVQEAKIEWEQEREQEEAGLEDDVRKDLEDALRDEYRKFRDEVYEFDRKKREWEEKQGLADKGAAFIGSLIEKPEGKMVVQAAATLGSALLNKFAQTKFPEIYAEVGQEYSKAEQIAREQIAQQQAATAQQAQQNPEEEKLVQTSTDKPDNYSY